jgi:hypothetical protein
MGLLDDAIREHLELKKRHGASDEEVTKLEAEVFGPGRLPAAPPPEPAPRPEPAREPLPESGSSVPGREPEPEPAMPGRTEPEPEPEPPMPGRREPEAEPPVAPVTEPPPPPAARVEPEPWLDDADADEVPASESLEHLEAPEEDVLEETPDFLQETPEHDRLWFEQKPPKGFDFDH